jgi:hypothetical protein
MKSSIAVALLLGLVLSAACNPIKRLSDAEWDHYRALRVYMTAAEKKAFLKEKEEENRSAYLQELGLWDRFYNYPLDVREMILEGEVALGWTKDKMLMAWGAPHDMQKLSGREARRSERFIYRFEELDDGRLVIWRKGSKTAYKAARLFQRHIVMDDDIVTKIYESGSW